MRVIVTGGAGFIGSNLIRLLLQQSDICILNIDKLIFPGCYHTIREFDTFPQSRYSFSQTDICEYALLNHLFNDFKPDAVLHLAAESHVDRSIDEPESFIQTNIFGTYNLLKISRNYWKQLDENGKQTFRFHHISTDEVFGSLEKNDKPFRESTPYAPNSPYSASKASADHLVRAWHHTYGLPVTLSNCSNNYGPCQYPDKLIPLMITKAINGEPLPVYGDGLNIRDWLYVGDHACALLEILKHGRIGESYNIGGNCEKSNIEVVNMICELLDELMPDSPNKPHKNLVTFVRDRPGHDRRYAMDTEKIRNEIGWTPKYNFTGGLRNTVTWYMKNLDWCNAVKCKQYDGERLGLQ